MTREYDDSWLYKKWNSTTRKGENIIQVGLRTDISLSDRVIALAEAYGIDEDELQRVTKDIERFILQPDARNLVIDKDELLRGRYKNPLGVFNSRARKTGIPENHARNLVMATIEHLAGDEEEDPEKYRKKRGEILSILYSTNSKD